MAAPLKYTRLIKFSVVLLSFCAVSSAETSGSGTQGIHGLEIRCGEIKVTIAVKRQFFRDRRVPFKPEFLRLGVNSTQMISCGPQRPKMSENEMVISAGLRDCGTESRVHGEWLVYSNQLLLYPAVVPTYTGSVIVRGMTTVIPVECHYKRKQKVRGYPVAPTWVPMTSTVSAVGLLHFSLRIMAGVPPILPEWLLRTGPNKEEKSHASCPNVLNVVCIKCHVMNFVRHSSVYQQGEAVFMEASVEAPLHPPLTLYVDYCVATQQPDPVSLPSYKFIDKHGCLMDSVLPGSSSRFLPREQDNRLCFSVQAFHFHQMSEEQMFITCHLRATLNQSSHNRLDKACFFHRPTFSWRATEGNGSLCECCDSDCVGLPGEKTSGAKAQPERGYFFLDTSLQPIESL